MYLFLEGDLYTHCSLTEYFVVVLFIEEGSPQVECRTSSAVMPIAGAFFSIIGVVSGSFSSDLGFEFIYAIILSVFQLRVHTLV